MTPPATPPAAISPTGDVTVAVAGSCCVIGGAVVSGDVIVHVAGSRCVIGGAVVVGDVIVAVAGSCCVIGGAVVVGDVIVAVAGSWLTLVGRAVVLADHTAVYSPVPMVTKGSRLFGFKEIIPI